MGQNPEHGCAIAPATFPKAERLRKRAEYVAVQRRGRKVQSDHFLLLLLPRRTSATEKGQPALELSSHPRARVGVTVSSKVGNAVVRNRVKRWVREWSRHHKTDLPAGDLAVVAKPSAAAVAHPVAEVDLARLMARARDLSR